MPNRKAFALLAAFVLLSATHALAAPKTDAPKEQAPMAAPLPPVPAPPPIAAPMPQVFAPPTAAEMLEERLAALKVGLKITSKQASLWEDFAKTALANAKAIENANKPDPKSASPSPMGMRTFLDELTLREKNAKQHIENIKKLKDAVEPLYKSFSEEQKRIADMRLPMELSTAM